MKKNAPLLFTLSLFLLFIYSGCGPTVQPDPNAPPPDPNQTLVDAAAVAVKVMRANPDTRSLNYLIDSAKGVMIFPQIVKAGMFLGGEGGRGVLVTRNDAGQWSSPAFYGMGGGSVGFQFGVQRASVIFVFMNDKVMNSAITTGVTLGADATLAAGPKSLEASASTKTAYSDIYYFSNVEGVFAGVSLDGKIMSIDVKANQAYYGQPADTRGILIEHKFDHPGAEKLKTALQTLQQ